MAGLLRLRYTGGVDALSPEKREALIRLRQAMERAIQGCSWYPRWALEQERQRLESIWSAPDLADLERLAADDEAIRSLFG